MSRISNDLAHQIAIKLTEASRIAADNLHVEFRELVTTTYENQTPDEVKNCFKKYPEWFYTRSSIRLHSHGFNWEYVSPTRKIICNSDQEAYVKLTATLADKLMKSFRKWQKAKEKHEELKREAKQALLTLKTFANIRKELPDAAPMLPPPISNALVVNFDSLKKRLSSQPVVTAADVPEEIDE